MTLMTVSLLMFHCNQKAIVRKTTISVPILFPCRAELVSVICLSWKVIHSNKCKSPFCVVGPVLIAFSTCYRKCTWQALSGESVCSMAVRTGSAGLW